MDVTSILLVGGSPEPSSTALMSLLASRHDVVVAVDRGLDSVLSAGLACDLFVGDADSVGERGAALVRAREERGEGPIGEVVRFDPHKDDTDLSLALRAAETRWPQARLTCTCLTGGRPDHALAVYGRLAFSRFAGGVRLREDGLRAWVLRGPLELPVSGCPGQVFSFVPLTPMARVSESGMRWNLDACEVALLSDLGISNVIESRSASITCHDGVIVAWLFDETGAPYA